MKRVLLLLAFTFLLALSVSFADEEFVEVDSDEFTETVGTSYEAPTVPSDRVFLFDNFNSDWKGRWIQSNNPKYNGNFRWVAPDVLVGIEGDKGLATTEGARHYGISTLITPPINLKTDSSKKSLVVQYEVKLQEKLECGGAYIKLLAQDDEFTPETLSDSSPYIIMFGPDRCGTNDKVHFIFRHQNPKSLLWEEKHLKSPPTIRNDQKTHLYTLIVHTEDNTYEILIDNASVKKGSLLEDFTPSVNPPKEIADPDDKKPEDWVDEAKIVDPSATKPDDWDENQPLEIVDPEDTKPEGWLDDAPAMIPDPNAQKPEDWDDEEDGEWEAPLIANPECEVVGCGEWAPRTIRNPLYKGKWTAPLIPNPEYKGEWAPRQIPNPHYFEDSSPAKFPAIGALAIEIWNMQGNILFDNILLTDDEKVASDYAEKTWRIKFQKETEKQPAPASHESPLKQYLPAGVWQFVEQTRAYLENFKELRPLLDVVDQFAIPIAATVSAVLLGSIVLCCCCMGSSKPARVITTATEKEVEASEKDKVIQEQSSEEEESDKKRESTSGVKKAPKENGQAKPRKSKPVKE